MSWYEHLAMATLFFYVADGQVGWSRRLACISGWLLLANAVMEALIALPYWVAKVMS